MRPLSASQGYAWRHTPEQCQPRAPELLYAALLAPRKHYILCHFYMLYLGPTWVRYMDAFINIITIMRTTRQIMQYPPHPGSRRGAGAGTHSHAHRLDFDQRWIKRWIQFCATKLNQSQQCVNAAVRFLKRHRLYFFFFYLRTTMQDQSAPPPRTAKFAPAQPP